jgi:hypothetical protein
MKVSPVAALALPAIALRPYWAQYFAAAVIASADVLLDWL